MKKVIRQSKEDGNNKKYITKRLTSNLKWVILDIINKERRKARKAVKIKPIYL